MDDGSETAIETRSEGQEWPKAGIVGLRSGAQREPGATVPTIAARNHDAHTGQCPPAPKSFPFVAVNDRAQPRSDSSPESRPVER